MPIQKSAEQVARESARAKLAAFDRDPDNYQGTVDLIDGPDTEKETDDGDPDDE
jgi:hypothetical protein